MMNRFGLQIHVMRLERNGEHFIFVYDREHISDVIQTLGRWASTPELDFSWYDAARLSKEVRSW